MGFVLDQIEIFDTLVRERIKRMITNLNVHGMFHWRTSFSVYLKISLTRRQQIQCLLQQYHKYDINKKMKHKENIPLKEMELKTEMKSFDYHARVL